MRRIFYYLFILSLLVLASCGNKGSNTTGKQSAVAKGEDSRMMSSHTMKYGIKSGVITFSIESNFNNEKQVKKVYFDDYGARETSETYKMDKLVEKRINKADGYVYILAIDKNSGFRSKHAMATGTEMKFDVSEGAWPNNMKKEYNYTKLPNETICGKDCEIFTTEYQKMKAKYAGWNGIILMTETSMSMGSSSMTTKSVAVKLEENVAVPESVFEVPAGMKLTEQ